MAKKILVVDDEAKLRRMIRTYLEQEGYQVAEAANGEEALFAARHEKPDLILLDVMMPKLNGIDFMRTYRKESDTPVIMLTARVDETDKVIGLELGADDYVTKPFGVRELIARVRAVSRRAQKQGVTPDVLRVGELTVDRSTRMAQRGDAYIDLTPSEFELLAALMSAPGRAYSRLELLEAASGGAYGSYTEGYERTIDVHIRNLRAKIESDACQPEYIQTVYGMGYRFATPGQKAAKEQS